MEGRGITLVLEMFSSCAVCGVILDFFHPGLHIKTKQNK